LGNCPENIRANSGLETWLNLKRDRVEIQTANPGGSRNATTILFDELLKDNAKDLIEKAIEMAKGGDGPALRLCIDRLAPPRKDRPVIFEIPKITEVKDAVAAAASIVAAVAGGDLTPAEAGELSKLVDSYARVLQAVEFEERISKLEKAVESR
jgi:hypothetical protein